MFSDAGERSYAVQLARDVSGRKDHGHGQHQAQHPKVHLDPSTRIVASSDLTGCECHAAGVSPHRESPLHVLGVGPV